MTPVVVNNIVSLDGFYADLSGDPTVLSMDESFDRANLKSIESAGVVLLGRDSFDGFSAYWPRVAGAPRTVGEDPSSRQYDDTNRAISRRWNAVPKVVVSDRGPIPEDNPWFAETTVVSRADAAGWIRSAAGEISGDIVVFASHVMWNGLLASGVIDELHLMLTPDVLGAGIPLFTHPARLQLLDTRSFEGSSNVQLRYSVQRQPPASD